MKFIPHEYQIRAINRILEQDHVGLLLEHTHHLRTAVADADEAHADPVATNRLCDGRRGYCRRCPCLDEVPSLHFASPSLWLMP